MQVAVFSVHCGNIAPEVMAAQEKVVRHFLPDGWTFEQVQAANHAAGLDAYLSEHAADVYIALDVDCIPLHEYVLPWMAEQATAGALVGCAQRANHLDNNQHVYAGPCGMAISRDTYDAIGHVSFSGAVGRLSDVAEELTYRCEEQKRPVRLLWPTDVVERLWDLVDGRYFGLGTTYNNSLFHAFGISHPGRSENMFLAKCREVLGEKTESKEAAPSALKSAGAIHPSKVLPVILSCAKDLSLFERFSASYRDCILQDSFASGVVIVDTSATTRLPASYLRTLNSLAPRSVHIHSREHGLSLYDSVQDAAFFALRCGLEEASGREELLLFLEDDVIFSSRFVEHLARAEVGPKMGFYSLYSPENEYGRSPIDPHRFYGTQAVLFPLEAARLLVQHQAQMEKDFRPGYDIRWSRFLASRGYLLYASRRSYVQHIGVNSRLGCMGHTSHNFEP